MIFVSKMKSRKIAAIPFERPACMSINAWIERYLADEVPKSKSLIVTVFGDSLLPNASGIWLGELIALMAPFGVSERLVRTSCFRLIDEDWLAARRDGRRSHYSLTPSGTRRIERAYQRVYTPPSLDWDGQWTLVVTPRGGETQPNRSQLRRELEWEGFALLAPGMLIHPVEKAEPLRQLLDELNLKDRAVVLRAGDLKGFGSPGTQALMLQCWNLDDVGARYRSFIEHFRPLLGMLDNAALTPQQAFLIQTLLIHSFRRATLHDPRLPAVLLPAPWPGTTAYELCRSLYALTARGAQAYVASVSGVGEALVASGEMSKQVRERFGGIDV